MSSMRIFLIFLVFSFASSNVTRNKRMSFDFQMNTKDNRPIDWDTADKAPVLEKDPPDEGLLDSTEMAKETVRPPANDFLVMPRSIPQGDQGDDDNTTTSSSTSESSNANDVPHYRLDCPPDYDLCEFFDCDPGTECAMDLTCSEMLCVDPNDENNIPTTTTDESKDSEFREDCPRNRNLCEIFDCPPNKRCAMNMECSEMVCIDPSPNGENPTPPMDPGLPDAGGGCTPDQNMCIYFPDACPPDKECAMNPSCTEIVCLDKDTESPHDGIEGEGGISRICDKGSFVECIHGKCGPDNRGCVCEKYWQGLSCNEPCTLDCVHGGCYVDKRGETVVSPQNITEDYMICNCRHGWQGKLCDEETPDLVEEEKIRTLKLGLSLGTVLLVTIIGSIATLIVLWRKRVIIVMKLVYFFKLEEGNDGKQYDAYISMGSSSKGIDFVKNNLCPKLEDQGFSLYVQARDQMVNEALSDSILNAMAQSRRTILIITLDYLENEWSRFEYLIAQIETLKLQQRIIPIVLEDISAERRNLNKTLKHILDSVKCLKYPKVKGSPDISLQEKQMQTKKQKNKENKFWKRLELTMPKKGNAEQNKLFNSNSSELREKNGQYVNGKFSKF